MNSSSKFFKLLILSVLFIILDRQSFGQDETTFESALQKAVGFKYYSSDSLIKYAEKALLIANTENLTEYKLDALIVLIEANIRSGELLNAFKLCDSIEKIKNNSNLLHRESDILLNIGNVYAAMGFAAEALDLFFKALNNKNVNISLKTKVDLYYYIAMVYFDVGEIEDCKKYTKQSMALAKENDYVKDVIPTYILLANTYNNIDSINNYLNLADILLKENNDLEYEKVVVLNSKAILNYSIGENTDSKSQYLKAIRISKSNGFEKHLANLYNNYAYLLMAENNYDSAKIVLADALKIAKEMKSADLQASIYDSYSDYYDAIENFKNAHLYQDSSIVKRNQFRLEQQAQRSLYLAAVFETEQKEKAILEQENKISRLLLTLLGAIVIILATVTLVVWFRQRFKMSKMKLEASERGKALEIAHALIKGQDSERKRLAMDLHDGLGAKMGSLRFFVDKNYRATKNYNELTSSLDDIKNSIRDLSHRMLPAQIEDLGLVVAINGLVKSINKSDKYEVDFDTNVRDGLSAKLETNLYYLIFELVNNATVHSKGNNIMIQLIEHDNRINLSVEDDGGGFDVNSAGGGTGMKNIKTRVEYLNGSYNIDAGDKDSVVYIEVPKHD